MHPKERYEEIITGKLAALPLPDMADAIWARIERQLDIDLPTDEGGDVPEPPSPWGGGGIAVGAGFLAVVGAILAFFYFYQPDKPTVSSTPINNTTENLAPAQNNTTINDPAPQAPFTQGANSPPLVPGDIKPEPLGDAAITNVATTATPMQDSTVSAPENFTAQSLVNAPPVLPDVQPDSVPKKRRGVQNVSDKDYRIVPKNNNGQ
jgi:hypothetical protein